MLQRNLGFFIVKYFNFGVFLDLGHFGNCNGKYIYNNIDFAYVWRELKRKSFLHADQWSHKTHQIFSK